MDKNFNQDTVPKVGINYDQNPEIKTNEGKTFVNIILQSENK